LVAPAERVLQERGAAPMLALAQYAQASICMTSGRYGEAVDHLVRLFDPSDQCFHLYYHSHVAADLIEAAAHAGRFGDIQEHLVALEEYRQRTGSKILSAGLVYGAPFREENHAEERYHEAIDSLRAWPFLLARTQLAYGMWLRRHRRLAEARQRLRIAAGSLPSLGALALAERAREELRAAGESTVPVGSSAWVSLTAHELHIAQLAAKGLTNRQIGDQMLISHRTVSTHLYNVYPKLGISGRGQLTAALRELEMDG
jgi:DNA-binding CsgD family transcriptional regulator